MHEIYAQAQNIVIWLGPESSWTKSALTGVNWLAEEWYKEIGHIRPFQIYGPLFWRK